MVFAPNNFINRETEWNQLINEFNKYLEFDGFKLICKKSVLSFVRAEQTSFNTSETYSDLETEEAFINKELGEIDFNKLNVESTLKPILESRLEEIMQCINSNSPLATIFLCGSTLEGVLLGTAQKNLMIFNQSNAAPKDKAGKVISIYDWKLSSLIDVAKDVGFIQKDVWDFSHTLRDYRNFIHPYHQMQNNFHPTIETAKLSAQVLRVAILQIIEKK